MPHEHLHTHGGSPRLFAEKTTKRATLMPVAVGARLLIALVLVAGLWSGVLAVL